MINLFKKIFKKRNNEVNDIPNTNLSCAILLIEVSYADFNISDVEINSIINLFEEKLNLSKKDAAWLSGEAKNLHVDTNCLRKYIKIINENYSNLQKKDLIKMAWQIARADNVVDKHEEHRIRKLSELLHLNHSDFIKAKIETK
jgi:uncharacterized tellurite resistance protein B-like protein|tara:strand:- start:565 stop:996 length:432 start_codon:yes stop_codon:yes gene_type:complete